MVTGVNMPLNNMETEKLFAKILKVSVKENSINQCRKTKLFLTVEQHSVNSILNKQELVVRLTDSNDPFFLYTLTLSEEDFQSLKAQQGLLVDFSSFPQKFIDLLELCLKEEDKELPRFLVTVDVKENLGSGLSPVQLNVVETNPFKHLTHLSLKLLAGTDSSVKKYLATCFKRLKDERDHLKSELEHAENELKCKLSSGQEIILGKTLELEHLQKEFKVKLTTKDSKHAEELQLERERLLTIQREGDQRWEKERKEKEQNYRKHTQQLEARVSCLDSLNKELQDKQYKSETTVRELRSHLISLEEDSKQTHQRLQNISKEKDLLDSKLSEKNVTLSQMKSQITDFEQDLEAKSCLISRLQDQLKITLEDKRKSEDILIQKKTILDKRESSLKSLSEEILKANEIIRKLQVELCSTHEKLKIRGKIAMKQEKCLSGKEDQLQKLQEDALFIKEQLKEKEIKNQELINTLAALTEKVDDYQKQIKTNENVIKWLNKQLTDAQLAQQTASNDPASGLNSQEPPFVVPKPSILNSTARGTLASSRVLPLSSTPFTVINPSISQNINPMYTGSSTCTIVPSKTTSAATVSLSTAKSHQLR